jgi:hypothetical protein
VIRSERLIVLGDSWFSAKSIEVEWMYQEKRGRATFWVRVAQSFTKSKKTPNTLFFWASKQILGAKVRNREGNSPDRRLRFQSNFLVGKEVIGL